MLRSIGLIIEVSFASERFLEIELMCSQKYRFLRRAWKIIREKLVEGDIVSELILWLCTDPFLVPCSSSVNKCFQPPNRVSRVLLSLHECWATHKWNVFYYETAKECNMSEICPSR